MLRTIALLLAVAFGLTTGFADAKSCRDPKTGKFIKCATMTPKPKPTPCRDKKTGKFIKCPSA